MPTTHHETNNTPRRRVSALVSEAVLGEVIAEDAEYYDETTDQSSITSTSEEGTEEDSSYFLHTQLGGKERRISRASLQWFQDVTLSTADANSIASKQQPNLIDSDGKISDDYIKQRQSINKPAILKSIPLLADLTTSKSITSIDGWCMTQLLLSGFALMNKQVPILNKTNVFPIADGDTGANMKVCLKLPVRNLLLAPSDNILTVVSNLAADVLLNGQGNSGTILSHFFVSLAEEIRDSIDDSSLDSSDSLTVQQLADCLVGAGSKMNDAVTNVQEGTMVSVARDCCLLLKDKTFTNLQELLNEWNLMAQTELSKTPDQLVVNGVAVLKEAGGVVDSGAQGFVYLIEGMHLASQGKLPEAQDISLFQRAKSSNSAEEESNPNVDVDHTVIDSAFQFCTEAVVRLKDGIFKDHIQNAMNALANDGACDSVAIVGAFGTVKVHCHSNDPDIIYNRLLEFSSGPILRKEKVEDMYLERQHMHEADTFDYSDAKFTLLSMGTVVLPESEYPPEVALSLPVFSVPSDTQEPIDCRFEDPIETNTALNRQRHTDTAIKYTTAASNPIQIKIELLAALSKGKPVLTILMSKDKNVSALGRNIMAAIDLLSEEQQKMITCFDHGWFIYEGAFIHEAFDCIRKGCTIEQTLEALTDLTENAFCFTSFSADKTVRKLVKWRPGLFPKDFDVEDGSWTAFGVPAEIRTGSEPWTGAKRAQMLFNVLGTSSTYDEAQNVQVQKIRELLLNSPGRKLASVRVQCAGRPDYGHRLIRKMRGADIPIEGEPVVYTGNFLTLNTSGWGEMVMMYKVV